LAAFSTKSTIILLLLQITLLGSAAQTESLIANEKQPLLPQQTEGQYRKESKKTMLIETITQEKLPKLPNESRFLHEISFYTK
jgi:hypothetical protein